MPQANVFGTIRDINGLYVKNATVEFNLLDGGVAPEGVTVPSIPVTTYTDDVGYFNVPVFANGTTRDYATYRVEVIEGSKILETYKIVVPSLRDEYALSELIQFEQAVRSLSQNTGGTVTVGLSLSIDINGRHFRFQNGLLTDEYFDY